MMGFANSTRSFCLDTWYLTFKPNFLRPQFVQKKFFWSSAFAKKRPLSTGTVSLRCIVAYQRWPIKANMQEVAVWPFCSGLWFIITLMCAGNSLRSTSWHQSEQQYGQKHYEARSQNISPTQKPEKASLWDYVNLMKAILCLRHSRNI